MNQSSDIVARALAVAAQYGIARARDFAAEGIAPIYIRRLCDEGRLIRLGRGLYQLPEMAGADANHDLAEAARLVPRGAICLLSALRFYDLTTQLPDAVWMLIAHKARAPRARQPRLEIVRASAPNALTDGVTEVQIETVAVRITSPARTIADCFKHRNRIGADVALEALQDALKQKVPVDEIMHYAELNRVGAVVRPYVQALIT